MPTKEDAVRAVLDASRNGCNRYIRYNPLTPRFIITDGVQELANAAGCYWLLDILATELEPKLMKAMQAWEVTGVYINMEVGHSGARIEATYSDDAPPFWSRTIDSTSFPIGDWTLFYISALEWDEQSGSPKNVVAILPTEY